MLALREDEGVGMEKVNGWNGGVAYRAEDVTLPEHRTLELWNTDGGHVGVSLRGSSGAVMYATISPDDFAEMAEALGFGGTEPEGESALRAGIEKMIENLVRCHHRDDVPASHEESSWVGARALETRLRALIDMVDRLPQKPGAGVLAKPRKGWRRVAKPVEFRRTTDGQWASTAGHWAEGDAEMLERWRIVEVL